MVERRRRKKNRLRANRTMGKGNTKNKRGAGTRGGRGRGGSKKHKRQLFLHEVGALRKFKARKKLPALNLRDGNKLVEKLLTQKDVQKEDGLVVFDGKKMRIEKVLSVGELHHKIVFKNVLVSKKAAEKISVAGGKVGEGTSSDGFEGEEDQ